MAEAECRMAGTPWCGMRAAGRLTARTLSFPPGTPVVEITRTAYTADGTAVEVNEMTADAVAYIFRYDFAAG